MKFDILKTRRGKLEAKISELIIKRDIKGILDAVDEYEKDNLGTIEKLKRERSLEINKINGALKQSINAHGPITKQLIGSASKRIIGGLLVDNKISPPIRYNYKEFFIGVFIGLITMLFIYYLV